MNIHIRTIIDKMEEALLQLKVEAGAEQPSQPKIQEHAIALRSYADLLCVANAVESAAKITPQLEQKPSIQQGSIGPIVPKNNRESLFDF